MTASTGAWETRSGQSASVMPQKRHSGALGALLGGSSADSLRISATVSLPMSCTSRYTRRMSPEECQNEELRLLREYKETIGALAVLHLRLKDIARNGYSLSQLMRTGPIGAEVVDSLAAIRETLTDYRRTRERCVALRETLCLLGLTEIIRDLTHPEL